MRSDPPPAPEPPHDELSEPALPVRLILLCRLLGDLEVAAVGVQRQSVRVARVDDEGDAGGEEGGGRLDVRDGGVVRAHLLDSGREKHTVHDGDIDAPFSNTVSYTASTPGPSTETENAHGMSRVKTALRTEPGIVLEGWGIRVEHVEGVDHIFLEFRNVLLSEPAHMFEASMVQVREGKWETERLREDALALVRACLDRRIMRVDCSCRLDTKP